MIVEHEQCGCHKVGKHTCKIQARPVLRYKDFLPKGKIVHRLETYRTKNSWYLRPFKGKYNVKLYALTDNAIYDVTEAL